MKRPTKTETEAERIEKLPWWKKHEKKELFEPLPAWRAHNKEIIEPSKTEPNYWHHLAEAVRKHTERTEKRVDGRTQIHYRLENGERTWRWADEWALQKGGG